MSKPKAKKGSTFADYMDIQLTRNEDGTVILDLVINENLLEDDNTIPTGVFSTMLDIVIGATISGTTNGFGVTISLNLSYLDLTNKRYYTAKANVVHEDGNYYIGEGWITDKDNNIVAKAIGTFKAVKKSN